ncbi:hypothetical protein G5B97_00375 [Campylobacter concisus]|uniref:hypothetical protein n=1 Tax=Campylobacter concisus TaxID=199 RepID=UPI0018A9AA08|nr:hypothetical protein [Campylobacter concisus]QPH98667.1 hypothetical protein G5B98_00370 [Campylobacter concisus]QPI00422.1 hypothetical protein G5B97_00375 [Campylobacter concisus]
MQENSKKCLLRTENKSFFDLSIYEYIGCIGVLESDIKKLNLYNHWCKVSRASTMLCVRHDSGESDNLVYLYDWEKFNHIYINTGN